MTADYPGTEVTIAGAPYVVPALNLKAFRTLFARGSKHLEAMQTYQGLPTPEQFATLAEVCAAALRRNYPEIDADWIEEHTSLSEFNALLMAVVQESGLLPKGDAGPKAQAP